MPARYTEITAGDRCYRFDRQAKAVFKENSELHHVPPQQLRLLEFFVSQPQHTLITKEQLRERLYGKSPVNPEAVSVAVKSLRKALGMGFIATAHGMGYRFVGDIRHWGDDWPPQQPSIKQAPRKTDAALISDAETKECDRLLDNENRTGVSHLELWVSNEATELRIHHFGDIASDTLGHLADQYTIKFEDKSTLIEAMTSMLTGLLGSMPAFVWNRSFKAGPGFFNSVILPFALDPGALAKIGLTGCTINIYPFCVEMDLWDGDGDALGYLDQPLDSIGIDFDAVGKCAQQLASAFGLRNATKACYPVVRLDDNVRGFPFLHMDLI